MGIAVFDIDGTLTDTTEVDVVCYEAAVREVVGVEIPESWPSMDEVTDTAILETTCRLRGVPAPDDETLRAAAERVGELLTTALAEDPGRFLPMPGAREVFDALRAAGWRVAMATGAWRPSALVKLEGAGIPFDGVPLATSSEYRSRGAIILQAISELDGLSEDRVVYVGDGVWDGRAATSLGYGFVGVGPAEREEALREVGARSVVPGLTDTGRLLARLEEAAGPR